MKKFSPEEARIRNCASRTRWRKRNREAMRSAEIERHREFRKNNRNRLNENRRARDARVNAKQKNRRSGQIAHIFGAGTRGASVVSDYELVHDRTRFAGPGATQTKRLEYAADKIMRAKKWTPRLRKRIQEILSQEPAIRKEIRESIMADLESWTPTKRTRSTS